MLAPVTFGLARLGGSALASALLAIRRGGGLALDTCAYADGDAELGVIDHRWAHVTTKLEASGDRWSTKDAVRAALGNLNVASIDRLLVHWPGADLDLTWCELAYLQRRGTVTELGVCNLGPSRFADFVATADRVGARPVVHQFESTPLGVNQVMVDLALKHGVTPQAWSPFGGPGATVLKHEVIVDVARRYACSPAQVVVAWNVQRGVSVVVQATTVDHVRELLTPVVLDDEDVGLISGLDQGWTSDPMTRDYYF